MHILLHFHHCHLTELYKEVGVSLEVAQFLVSENAKFERRVNRLCTTLFLKDKQAKKIIWKYFDGIQLQSHNKDWKTICFLIFMLLCNWPWCKHTATENRNSKAQHLRLLDLPRRMHSFHQWESRLRIFYLHCYQPSNPNERRFKINVKSIHCINSTFKVYSIVEGTDLFLKKNSWNEIPRFCKWKNIHL